MLFRLECKKIICSIAFIIYCIISFFFFFTQYYGGGTFREMPPVEGVGDYGDKIEENHDVIMSGALDSLVGEYAANKYVCYPFGFYKGVHLKDKKQAKIAEYLKELTGTDDSGLGEILGTGEQYFLGESTEPMYAYYDVPISDSLTYERFTEIMGDIDDILGGGSEYDPDALVSNYSFVPMTYEEAKAEYDDFYTKDRITGGLARLFSDYSGIALGIIPVFAAASLTAADRKRRMHELIYTRSISSLRLVLTRYAALIFTMSIPVFVQMLIALVQAIIVYKGEPMDYLGFFKLPTVWLLPILMTSTAVGMFITEIFSSTAAIFVQVALWFYSVMTGSTALAGRIGRFGLICRHNTATERSLFIANAGNFIFSRIFWTVVSLALVGLTAAIYNAKRGGRFNGIRLFGKDSIFRRKA